MTAEHRTQHDVALAAKEDLFNRLLNRLMNAMLQGGPAAAIPVCKAEASEIAIEVGKDHGVQIGRTSHRLRNVNNAPPDWAKEFVDDQIEESRFVAMDNGQVGALLPIRLKTPCLMCHGPPESLAPGVGDVLTAEYPLDKATGFHEGDLRGWFWIVVPAGASLPEPTPEEIETGIVP